jgi:hypothetical protein
LSGAVSNEPVTASRGKVKAKLLQRNKLKQSCATFVPT